MLRGERRAGFGERGRGDRGREGEVEVGVVEEDRGSGGERGPRMRVIAEIVGG